MSSSPIAQALQEIAEQKGLDYEIVLGTLEIALAAAFRKDFGEKNQNIVVRFNAETGAMTAFDVKTVVEDQELPAEDDEEAYTAHTESQYNEAGEEIKRFNPKTEIMRKDAYALKPDAQLGDVISTELTIPAEFGRMAAQTAKQVITQKLREAERNAIFDEYKGKEHTIVTGTIGRREPYHILVDLGRGTGILPVQEQVPGENYRTGARMKMYLMSVNVTSRGPELILSRAHPELIREVFQNEIPEIASGVVTIKALVREAGSRAKVAVHASDEAIDPVGSCIGQRGTRIQTIIAELGGEKIDLILWSDDQVAFITQAIAPAKVLRVELNDAEKIAVVIVSEDQLSLAIGRGGQNVRLAARLTGWKINVRDEKGVESSGTHTHSEVSPAPAETLLQESPVTPETEPEKTPETTDADILEQTTDSSSKKE